MSHWPVNKYLDCLVWTIINCFYEHLCINHFIDPFSFLLGGLLNIRVSSSYSQFMFFFLRNLSSFSKWLYHFKFPAAMNNGFVLSITLSKFSMVRYFYFNLIWKFYIICWWVGVNLFNHLNSSFSHHCFLFPSLLSWSHLYIFLDTYSKLLMVLVQT